MKKLLSLLALSLLLVGCSDAYVSVSDKNTPIFTVGNKSVTKDQMYDLLVVSDAGYTAITMSTNFILSEEVEVTDEMRASADESLSFYETIYSDTLLETIQTAGFIDLDDFYENNLLATEKIKALTKKYIDINFSKLVESYSPKKAITLSFANESDALAAKAALESGMEVSEIVTQYNSLTDGSETIVTTNSNLDTSVLSYILDASEPQISSPIIGASVENYFIIQILETDAEAMRDEVIDTLSLISAVTTESDLYYFNQYGFKVYDRTLHDLLETNYPNYMK